MNITDKKYTNEDYEFDEYYINKLFIRIPKAGDGKFI